MPSEIRDVPGGMEVAVGDGPVVRIQAVAENIVRVRVSSDGQFVDSPLNRYGFILLDADSSAGRTGQDEKAGWLKTPRK